MEIAEIKCNARGGIILLKLIMKPKYKTEANKYILRDIMVSRQELVKKDASKMEIVKNKCEARGSDILMEKKRMLMNLIKER